MRRLLLVLLLILAGCSFQDLRHPLSLTFRDRYPSRDLSGWPSHATPMLTPVDGELIEEDGNYVRIYASDGHLIETGVLHSNGMIDLYDPKGDYLRTVKSNYASRWLP